MVTFVQDGGEGGHAVMPEATDPALSELPDFEYPEKPKVLEAEEEVHLAMLLHAGRLAAAELAAETPGLARRRELRRQEQAGVRAREWLILCNMGLVYEQVKRFRKTGIPEKDLEQYALGAVTGPKGPVQTGLIHAVDKFDYTKGYKFSTYAMDWIVSALQYVSALHNPMIRVPRSKHDAILSMVKYRDELRLETGGEPGVQAISERMGRTPTEVKELIYLYHTYWKQGAIDSWDRLIAPHGSDGDPGASVGDFTPDHTHDPDDPEQTDRMALHIALGRLTARQQLIVSMTYGMTADGRSHSPAGIARALSHGETAEGKCTAGEVRAELEAAMAAVHDMLADSTADGRVLDVPAADVHVPAATTERTPDPDRMSFDELMRDVRFYIAVERLILISSPERRQLLADRYPQLPVARIGTLSGTRFEPKKATVKLAALEDNLRRIIRGTMDYTHSANFSQQPRHVLLFMGSAGLPVPNDAGLGRLRDFCRKTVERSKVLSVDDKRLLVRYYDLGAEGPVLPADLAGQYGLKPSAMRQSASYAMRLLARELSQHALSDQGEGAGDDPSRIEALAAEVPVPLWFSVPGLRIVASRGLDTISPLQSAIIAHTYRFGHPDMPDRLIADKLSIAPKVLWAVRSAALKNLSDSIPRIAAGTNDYLAEKTGASFRQGVVEMMVRSGLDVDPGADVPALRDSAVAQLDRKLAGDVDAKKLLIGYYGLTGSGVPRTAAELAEDYGLGQQAVRRRVLRTSQTLAKMAADRRERPRRPDRPLVTAAVLRRVVEQAEPAA